MLRRGLILFYYGGGLLTIYLLESFCIKVIFFEPGLPTGRSAEVLSVQRKLQVLVYGGGIKLITGTRLHRRS